MQTSVNPVQKLLLYKDKDKRHILYLEKQK